MASGLRIYWIIEQPVLTDVFTDCKPMPHSYQLSLPPADLIALQKCTDILAKPKKTSSLPFYYFSKDGKKVPYGKTLSSGMDIYIWLDTVPWVHQEWISRAYQVKKNEGDWIKHCYQLGLDCCASLSSQAHTCEWYRASYIFVSSLRNKCPTCKATSVPVYCRCWLLSENKHINRISILTFTGVLTSSCINKIPSDAGQLMTI